MFYDEFSEVAFERNSYELLLVLLSEYSSEASSGDRKSEVSDWIEHSYMNVISLESAAEHFHLTPQYFSSWFAENFGMPFIKYLSSVRCENARKDLVLSRDTILRIALDNGFPNAGSFSRTFAAMYGQTPVQYRKEHSVSGESVRLKAEDISDYIQREDDISQNNDVIRISITETNERLKPYWKRICNASDITALSDREMQDQVAQLLRNITFDVVRVMLVFHGDKEETGFYKEDKAISFLVGNGLSALFVINFRQLSNEEAFIAYLREFVRHIIHKYGYTALKFEVLYDTIFDKKKASVYLSFLKKIRTILAELCVECTLYGPGLLLNRDGSNLLVCLKENSELDVVTIISQELSLPRSLIT